MHPRIDTREDRLLAQGSTLDLNATTCCSYTCGALAVNQEKFAVSRKGVQTFPDWDEVCQASQRQFPQSFIVPPK